MKAEPIKTITPATVTAHFVKNWERGYDAKWAATFAVMAALRGEVVDQEQDEG